MEAQLSDVQHAVLCYNIVSHAASSKLTCNQSVLLSDCNVKNQQACFMTVNYNVADEGLAEIWAKTAAMFTHFVKTTAWQVVLDLPT